MINYLFIGLFILLGFMLGGLLVFLDLNPKVKTTQKLDKEIEEQNEKLKDEHQRLNEDTSKLLSQNSSLAAQKEEILNSIKDLKRQSKETADALYEQSQILLNERMDNAAKEMSEKYQKAEEEAKTNYLETLKECSISLAEQIAKKEQKLIEISTQMDDLTKKVSAAVQAYQRQQEIDEKQDFYRLQLTEIDIKEIAKLREVSCYLRDTEPLNKVIWKVYYEKPYTDLIGRVIGSGVHTGIYKITNIENHMCYIGQAVNLADRWRQHIKRGVGADAPTRNKLYPAMLEYGVENFTFEVIEECNRSMLNEREDYWQDYFKAKEYGYSIK